MKRSTVALWLLVNIMIGATASLAGQTRPARTASIKPRPTVVHLCGPHEGDGRPCLWDGPWHWPARDGH
jgi:hypothetical protein